MSHLCQCFVCNGKVMWPSPELVVVGLSWTGDERDPVRVEDSNYAQVFAHRGCIEDLAPEAFA